MNDASFNFVQFLQEIASEQQFEVTYVDIEEKSMTGISAGVTGWGVVSLKLYSDVCHISVICNNYFIVPGKYQFNISDRPTHTR